MKEREVSPDRFFVDEAYRLEDRENLIDFYRKWAEDYDRQMVDNLNYLSPTLIAQVLTAFLSDRNSRMLDIGCGFENALQRVVDSDSIGCLYREQDCFYEGSEPEGWFCVYQKI